MMSFFKKAVQDIPIVVYNSLTRQKDIFVPLRGRNVGMYTCGPTVYGPAHIGNLRSYVFSDVLKRTLEYAGYQVKHVINITDVGHLVGDGDEGEDKMTAGLKREGLELTLENMKIMAEKYAHLYIEDVEALNIELPFIFPRASEHIGEQIAVIQSLMDKGYAYTTSDGVYFDTQKFPKYGALGGSSSAEHSRIGVNEQKHDLRDFTLWKLDSKAGWDAPWGKGFPGWHIECTAMSMKYLGKSFDVHTGGVDHIAIHHNNEIAQSEAVSGAPFVKYFMHGEFLTIDGQRIGKSLGNTITLAQLKDRGILPIAYRYWLLTGHYRQKINFTWSAVEGAQTALHRALRIYSDLQGEGHIVSAYRDRFIGAIRDDLNTSEGVAIMWELLKDEKVLDGDKKVTLNDFDRILGLGFTGRGLSVEMEKLRVVANRDIPPDIENLLALRKEARANSNWGEADRIRNELEAKGYTLEDTKDGLELRMTGNP
jgi:cysteinyl-tRNA synthetase